MTYPDHVLLDRMRNVFDDTLEIADWFKQEPDEEYNYRFAETRTHLIGMWETMQDAADRLEALINRKE
jgi:broad specificity phosphatase PhoE